LFVSIAFEVKSLQTDGIMATDSLLEHRPQEYVGVTDRAGRQASVEQFAESV